MKIQINQEGTTTVVHVIGEVNTPDVEPLRQALEEAVQASSGSLIVDASQLEYINSAAVGIIASIQRTLKATERGALVIRHPQATIARLLRVTRLDTVVTVIEKKDGGEKKA